MPAKRIPTNDPTSSTARNQLRIDARPSLIIPAAMMPKVAEGHDLDEAIRRQPFLSLDHMVVHHRDLSDWPANIHEAEEQKVQKDFAPQRHRRVFVAPALTDSFLVQ